QRLDVLVLQRRAPLVEASCALGERLALPAAHPRELVELVQLPPLRRDPVPVPEQPVFAIESLVMAKANDDFLQHGFPTPLLAVVAALERRLIRRDESLDDVEGAVPQACLHRARALVVRRILGSQVADHRIASSVDAQQRLSLIGTYRAAAT